MSSNTIRRGLRNSKRSPRDKRRVSSLVPEIYSRVNGIKRTKKTQSKESEILRNYKAPIGAPPILHMWGLW
jgi:hypothetical protein